MALAVWRPIMIDFKQADWPAFWAAAVTDIAILLATIWAFAVFGYPSEDYARVLPLFGFCAGIVVYTLILPVFRDIAKTL